MRFAQNNPLIDYRKNLILTAALEVESLHRLASSSAELTVALASLRDQETLLRVLNQFAYKAIDQLVPEFIAEHAQQHLVELPISLNELKAVLNRPISDGLQIFERE